MPKSFLEKMLRKPVVVRANGLTYKGILIEVAPFEILLRRQTGYVSIPMDRITSITDPSAPKAKGPARFVDRSFYSVDVSEETNSTHRKVNSD